MSNSISIHKDESNRLELQFREAPKDVLKDYLVNLGFVNHIGKPKQFFAPYRDAYKHVANDLKKVLENNGDFFQIEIHSSSEAVKESIDNDLYSTVSISYRGTANESISETYIVFDNHMRIAKAIGMQYASKKYGSTIIDVSASPRSQRTKARKLFKEGKILGRTKPIETTTKQDVELGEDQNAFTESTKVYEEIEIPIPKAAKYTASIKLLEESGLYYYGISETKEFGDYFGSSSPATNHNTAYPSRKKAISAALNEIANKIQNNISRDDYQLNSQDKKVKLLDKAIVTVREFATQHDIELQNVATKNAPHIVLEKEQAPPTSNDVILLPMSTQKKEEETEQEPYTPKSIREQLITLGFTPEFTGDEVMENNLPVIDIYYRWGEVYNEFERYVAKNFTPILNRIEKKLKKLNQKKSEESQTKVDRLLDRKLEVQSEVNTIEALIIEEHELFLKELFQAIMENVPYDMNSEEQFSFEEFIMPRLIEGGVIESYAHEPLRFMVDIFIKDYFSTQQDISNTTDPDYVDKVIAMMHEQYIKGKRVTKKQIETLKDELGVPNLGMLWEAAELSWLLWYKQLYNEHISFELRLQKMIHFWDTIQPTYAYSDSSKELYKQYSTPCPIGAIIAKYTDMKSATAIFEPSAGNGLLVLGADPRKTHVNEIDNDRRYSLELQGFKTITNVNAAEPFDNLEQSFDVVVTNPPFDRWEETKFDKKRIVKKYFNNRRGLEHFMRLEHLMCGLGLRTLKDNGKAALIIMGHAYFDDQGYFRPYRPFFNWLCHNYHVEDIINLNSFKLYNKQGAVAKTMLVLINGRKAIPSGTAPKKEERPELETMVNDFESLWRRVASHIKSPLEVLTQQLKLINHYDLLQSTTHA